jgi:hypothetical protein
MTEFRAHVDLLNYLPGMHCIIIPATAIRKLKDDAKKRLVCTVNSELEFSCGILPMKNGKGFIMFNRKRMKELGVMRGDTVMVHLRPDQSKYGMQMPDELAEILRQDPEADERFHNLTPGKQRNIIMYVTNVKNPDARIERGFKLMNNLKSLPPGKETARKIFGL